MGSPNIEDYLVAIHRLHGEDAWVAPSAIAAARGVKPPTVTRMLQRLHDDGLVEYERYRGARLTARGERRALAVLRHHRLLELFLTRELGYDWSEVHEEADVLEHHISETLAERIAAHLGHPTVDPHGAPIPTADLDVRHDREQAHVSLAQCEQGTTVAVSRVGDHRPDVLAYLSDAGVSLGTALDVIEVSPIGLLTVEVGDTGDRVSLPIDVASDVRVSEVDGSSTHGSAQYSEVHQCHH